MLVQPFKGLRLAKALDRKGGLARIIYELACNKFLRTYIYFVSSQSATFTM